jgi:high-affinity Fe2+/Pb2+ permease
MAVAEALTGGCLLLSGVFLSGPPTIWIWLGFALLIVFIAALFLLLRYRQRSVKPEVGPR